MVSHLDVSKGVLNFNTTCSSYHQKTLPTLFNQKQLHLLKCHWNGKGRADAHELRIYTYLRSQERVAPCWKIGMSKTSKSLESCILWFNPSPRLRSDFSPLNTSGFRVKGAKRIMKCNLHGAFTAHDYT